LAYDWPGNIRELENAVERAVVFCRGGVIGPELLSSVSESAEYVSLGWDEARELALKRFERSYLTLAMRLHKGSVTKTAEALGISRQALYKAMERNGIDPDSVRG
jgi:two-component system response regulator HydG